MQISISECYQLFTVDKIITIVRGTVVFRYTRVECQFGMSAFMWQQQAALAVGRGTLNGER